MIQTSRGVGTVALSIVMAAIVATLISAGLAYTLVPRPASTLAKATDRLIYLTAVEYKGSTEVAKLVPPKDDPKSSGPAYGFKWVEPNVKWEVSAYAFSPATVIVNQGDKVTLRIFGVNGDKHIIYVEGLAENPVTLERGRTVDLNFVANKPGIFRLICSNHEPHMKGELIVLGS